MPGVLAPVVAARMELILIDVVEELRIEDVLIDELPAFWKGPSRSLRLSKPSPQPGLGEAIHSWRMRERWNLAGSTSRLSSSCELRYWTSFNTACWAWFACWRAAIPVDCRTLYWVILATVFPMSAF